jgi:hypothetical protein
MPAGEAPVLCARTRDACRLALVVLPPATPPPEPPAGAFGSPAANGTALDTAHPSTRPPPMPPILLAPATNHMAAGPPAPQQFLGQAQQLQEQPQQPISEIVSLDVADGLGTGSGAVVFVHPELAQLEALAQRLEKDAASALHGAPTLVCAPANL